MSLLCKTLRIFALFTAAVAFFWVLFAPPARAQGMSYPYARTHRAPPARLPGLIQASPTPTTGTVSTQGS